MDYYEKIEQLLAMNNHKTKVRFAYYCACDVLQYADKKSRPVLEDTLSLVLKWIDTGDVSKKDLEKASSSAAANAANAATYADAANAADYNKVYSQKMRESLLYLLDMIGYNNSMIRMVL